MAFHWSDFLPCFSEKLRKPSAYCMMRYDKTEYLYSTSSEKSLQLLHADKETSYRSFQKEGHGIRCVQVRYISVKNIPENVPEPSPES